MVLTCSSEASPPVKNSGYILYREGRFVGFGQNHTIPDVQPDHSGRYHCQAWNSISSAGIETFNSAAVLLQVYCTYVDTRFAAVADVPGAADDDDDDEDDVEFFCSPRPPSEHFHLDEPGPCRVGQQCEFELLQCCQPSCRKLHLVLEDRPQRLQWAAGGLRTGAVYFLHGGVPLWTVPLPGQEPAGGEELDRDAAGHGGRGGGAGSASGALWKDYLGKK